MFPVSSIEQMEAVKWSADPETMATLQYLVQTLTTPEADGLTMLERVYLNCPHENQRCEEVQTAALAFIGKRFKEKAAFFQADLPDDGRCRFQLRLADHYAELKDAQPAKAEWFLNLLKPHEEWICAPKLELVLTTPAPKPVSAQKPESKQPAKGKPVPAGMGAKLGRGKS